MAPTSCAPKLASVTLRTVPGAASCCSATHAYRLSTTCNSYVLNGSRPGRHAGVVIAGRTSMPALGLFFVITIAPSKNQFRLKCPALPRPDEARLYRASLNRELRKRLFADYFSTCKTLKLL